MIIPNHLPLQKWYISGDKFVYDSVNRVDLTLETRDLFTNVLIQSRSIKSLVSYAISLLEIIQDFIADTGVVIKNYRLGKSLVQIQKANNGGLKIKFENIKHTQLLHDTCVTVADLAGLSWQDVLELDYFLFK